MKCYHPIPAIRRADGSISLARDDRRADRESLELPCGLCVGCRLARGQSWAVRAVHESRLYDRNCFVTLTYDDDNIPEHGSLRYADVQRFFKRLRKRFQGDSLAPSGHRPVRYLVAGEYGSRTLRPHYHALLFNIDFRHDARPWGRDTWRSPSLEKLWPFGSSLVGSFTPATAAYVARYCLKKVYSRQDPDFYDSTVDQSTGEVHVRVPEFVQASRNPGLGFWFFQRYKSDFYPSDQVIFDGRPVPVPKYYRLKLRDEDPQLAEEVEYERYLRARSVPLSERTPERRAVSETVRKAALDHFYGERGF